MYVPFRLNSKLNFIIVNSQIFLYLCFDLGHNLRNSISRTFTVLRVHCCGLREALFLDFVCLVLMLPPGFLKYSFLVSSSFLTIPPRPSLGKREISKGSAGFPALDNTCCQKEGGLVYSCKPFFFQFFYSFLSEMPYPRSPLANFDQSSNSAHMLIPGTLPVCSR